MLSKFVPLAVAAAVMLAPVAAKATVETIDLNAAPLGTFSSMTVSGFNFQWIGYGDQQTVAAIDGQNVLQDSNQTNSSGAQVTISRAGGGTFSLLSADIAALSGNNGYRIDIGTSSYYSIPASFETVNPSGAKDVTGVPLNIVDGFSDYAVKNLVVSFTPATSVPEPGSLALLGTGLLGLGLIMRRKRRA